MENGFTTTVNVPNDLTDYRDFSISYNVVDTGIYGCDTTAIVIGQMQHFMILNGDHVITLEELAGEGGAEGLDACIDYFNENQDLRNFRSDDTPDRKKLFEMLNSFWRHLGLTDEYTEEFPEPDPRAPVI